MKYLWLLLLPVLCSAQEIGQLQSLTPGYREIVVVDTVFKTPSGKVLKESTHTEVRHIMNPRTAWGCVTVIVQYGCPVCGSEEVLPDKENYFGVPYVCKECGSVYAGRQRNTPPKEKGLENYFALDYTRTPRSFVTKELLVQVWDYITDLSTQVELVNKGKKK